jgi:hypothetical protein
LCSTDISTDHIQYALFKLSKGENPSTVGLLLQRCTDIPAEHIDDALYNPIEGGHAPIDLLLLHRTDISAH